MHTHLLRYDSDYGRFPAEVTDGDDSFTVDGHEIAVFQADDPEQIDWGAADVQVVVEATGAFRDREVGGPPPARRREEGADHRSRQGRRLDGGPWASTTSSTIPPDTT